MAARQTAAEMAEEFTRLDQELKLLQKELEDTLQLNDNFQKSIEQKGEELAAKDEYLMSLREKNAAEVEQLQLEEMSTKENCIHEINFHTVELHNLKIKQRRLQEVREENARLKDSLEYLQEQTNKDRLNHALAMHEMNKEMKLLRQQMEQKLRKELAGLELSFQEEAFNALQDKQKQAMLENAKLKDEVALQGVGISNLTTRLIKQQIAHEKCKKILTKFEKKSHVLRERLAEGTIFKNNLLRLRENLLKEEYALLQEKERLAQQLHLNSMSSAGGTATATATATATNSTAASVSHDHSPSSPSRKSQRKPGTSHRYAHTMMVVNDLINRYINAKETFRNVLTRQKLWINRYDSIKNILIDLRPTNENEKNGNFQRKHFPLQELIQQITFYIQQQAIIDPVALNRLPILSHSQKFSKFDKPLTPLIQSENSSVTGGALSTTTQGSEVLFEIQKVIKQDVDLAEALKHLRGKESSILTAFQEGNEEKKGGNKQNEDEEEEDNLEDENKANKEDASVSSTKKDEDKDQNMIAWTVLKIITLWFGAEEKIERNMYTIDEFDEGEGEDQDQELLEQLEEEKLGIDVTEVGKDEMQVVHETREVVDTPYEDSDIIWPPLHEEVSPHNSPVGNMLQTSSLEKYSSLSTNSQVQEQYYYDELPAQKTTFQIPEGEAMNESNEGEDEEGKNRVKPIEAIDDWEAKMLNDIQQVRESEDAKKLLGNRKQQATGIEYYDNPPETSSWLYKVPPRPGKLSAFTKEMKEKLISKPSNLSLREREEYRKKSLNLTEIGPPIIIHEFLSPLAHPSSSTSSFSPPRASTARSSNNLQTATTHSNTMTSYQPQRKESQLLHYESDRDPLLFNQKRKNLVLPKTPQTDNSELHHSSYKRETVTDRTLPRKLAIALSKTSSTPMIQSTANTPGFPAPLTAGTPKDPLMGRKHGHGKKKGLSHSTGALLSLK